MSGLEAFELQDFPFSLLTSLLVIIFPPFQLNVLLIRAFSIVKVSPLTVAAQKFGSSLYLEMWCTDNSVVEVDWAKHVVLINPKTRKKIVFIILN